MQTEITKELYSDFECLIGAIESKKPNKDEISYLKEYFIQKLNFACDSLFFEISDNNFGELALKNPEKYISEFCEKHELNLKLLQSNFQKRYYVEPRQALHYIFHKICGFSTTITGGLVGNKDHATVLHSCRKVVEQPHYYTKYFKS